MSSETSTPLAGKSTAEHSKAGLLAAVGVSAVLDSSCCLGPLILVGLGVTGAWIGKLAALERLRPWLLATAGATLLAAAFQIFQRGQTCAPGQACSLPAASRAYKVVSAIVALVFALAIVFPYLARFLY